jgi:predicted Ser/Thr protein kinase
MVGQNQIGDYKLIELAGEGSFGKVWKARRTGSLQTVAVKLITKHGKNEKDLRNLRQEIEILRKLQHPNIIAMLDAFETKNDFCVVTEFAQGEGQHGAAACPNFVLQVTCTATCSTCIDAGCCPGLFGAAETGQVHL